MCKCATRKTHGNTPAGSHKHACTSMKPACTKHHAYQCLYKVHSLQAGQLNVLEQVHNALHLHTLNLGIDGHICSRATCSIAAPDGTGPH